MARWAKSCHVDRSVVNIVGRVMATPRTRGASSRVPWGWLFVSLLSTFDIVSDIFFAVEIANLRARCAEGSPDGVTINFDNGTETCSNLNISSEGVCPTAAEKMVAYCGYGEICGSDDDIGTCYVNAQCGRNCSKTSGETHSTCVEDSCSPQSANATYLYIWAIFFLLITLMKEGIKVVGTYFIIVTGRLSGKFLCMPCHRRYPNSMGVTSSVSFLLIFFQRDKLDEYNDLVQGKNLPNHDARSSFVLWLTLDMVMEDVPQIILAAAFTAQWGFAALPASTISLVVSCTKVASMLHKIRLSRLQNAAHPVGDVVGNTVGDTVGDTVRDEVVGKRPTRSLPSGKVVLWLVVWLIFLFDVVVDIYFITEISYLGRVCATGVYDQQIPGIGTDSKLFSVQHRDGNESCTDLDLTASGTCSQDATRLFDYCGWQTMCGSGYTNTVEKCFINLDCRCSYAGYSPSCGENQKACSPNQQASKWYLDFHVWTTVVGVLIVFKELFKIRAAVSHMFLWDESEQKSRVGKFLISGFGAVQSLFSIFLICFRPNEMSNFAKVVDPDCDGFFWMLVGDLVIEDGPMLIITSVFISFWGDVVPETTVLAKFCIATSCVKLLLLMWTIANRTTHVAQSPGRVVSRV
eukprot:m.350937 g.350937  ORF g.350937 m.350937 type:complete len:633 (+) comp27971_c0_seq14:601-2499(+)